MESIKLALVIGIPYFLLTGGLGYVIAIITGLILAWFIGCMIFCDTP